MRILDDLLSTIDLEAPVRDVRQGVFHTAVLTRHCGLAATLPRDALRQRRQTPLMKDAGLLLDKSAGELSRMAYSTSLLEAAVGMATINSLLEVDESAVVELNASELILEKGRDKAVAIVGHFPFIPRIGRHLKHLWVIEKNPSEGDLPEAESARVIPEADVVAITGTALTNHTLEGLLELCRPGAFVILLGDSAPLCPALFDYGIDALAGTRVTDTERVLNCVSQGATFRQIKGTRRLTMLRQKTAR